MLKERLAELGCKLLQKTLKDLPHCLLKSEPQPDSGITYGMSYSFARPVEHVTSNLCTVVFQAVLFTAR
jgi:methionyl-tRNA formyltransferase